eukprot:scaffold6749_cov114-Isochrysis_galbana.AAC.4
MLLPLRPFQPPPVQWGAPAPLARGTVIALLAQPSPTSSFLSSSVSLTPRAAASSRSRSTKCPHSAKALRAPPSRTAAASTSRRLFVAGSPQVTLADAPPPAGSREGADLQREAEHQTAAVVATASAAANTVDTASTAAPAAPSAACSAGRAAGAGVPTAAGSTEGATALAAPWGPEDSPRKLPSAVGPPPCVTTLAGASAAGGEVASSELPRALPAVLEPHVPPPAVPASATAAAAAARATAPQFCALAMAGGEGTLGCAMAAPAGRDTDVAVSFAVRGVETSIGRSPARAAAADGAVAAGKPGSTGVAVVRTGSNAIGHVPTGNAMKNRKGILRRSIHRRQPGRPRLCCPCKVRCTSYERYGRGQLLLGKAQNVDRREPLDLRIRRGATERRRQASRGALRGGCSAECPLTEGCPLDCRRWQSHPSRTSPRGRIHTRAHAERRSVARRVEFAHRRQRRPTFARIGTARGGAGHRHTKIGLAAAVAASGQPSAPRRRRLAVDPAGAALGGLSRVVLHPHLAI